MLILSENSLRRACIYIFFYAASFSSRTLCVYFFNPSLYLYIIFCFLFQYVLKLYCCVFFLCIDYYNFPIICLAAFFTLSLSVFPDTLANISIRLNSNGAIFVFDLYKDQFASLQICASLNNNKKKIDEKNEMQKNCHYTKC